MKGYVYTLEVMLAVALIIVTVVFIFGVGNSESETDVALMKQTGYDALFYLDQSGELRDSMSRGALTEINANLTFLLPVTVNFDTNICQGNCVSSILPENRTIAIVDYYVSASKERYIERKLRLWIWRKF
jgi:hypothetical protein